MAMHDHGRLSPLGKVPQMPGMLAFFENAVFNDRAPVIGIKDHERIADRAIGQVDEALGSRSPVVPASDDYRVDGLALVVAAMGMLRVVGVSIAVIGG